MRGMQVIIDSICVFYKSRPIYSIISVDYYLMKLLNASKIVIFHLYINCKYLKIKKIIHETALTLFETILMENYELSIMKDWLT